MPPAFLTWNELATLIALAAFVIELLRGGAVGFMLAALMAAAAEN